MTPISRWLAGIAAAVLAYGVGWYRCLRWIERRGGPYQEGYQQGFDDGIGWGEGRDPEPARDANRKLRIHRNHPREGGTK